MMKTGVTLILEERGRQLHVKGFDEDNDDDYVEGDLKQAAEAYIEASHYDGEQNGLMASELETAWPWTPEWFKPGKPVDGIRCLVKAGALIAAEIDRLHRQRVREEAV